MDILMDPECDIPDFITDINHISNEDVVGCPTEKEMCQQIIDFLESADVITGYNSHNFDNWFIDQMSRRGEAVAGSHQRMTLMSLSL